MRKLILAGLFAVCLVPASFAAPLPKDTDTTGPQIMVQVQSAADLIGKLKSTVKSMLPPEIFKEFEKEGLRGIDPAQIKFLDPKKPAGLYASIDEAIFTGQTKGTSVVVLIPVKGESEVIDHLAEAGIKYKKKDDVYTVSLRDFVEGIPELTVRFVDGYAYIGIGDVEALSAKNLIAAKDFFSDKETAAITAKIRPDRISKEVKRVAVDGLGLAPLFVKDALPDGMIGNFGNELVALVTRYTKSILGEGREVALRVDLNPKNANFEFEITVDGAAKSTLAESISKYAAAENRFATIVGKESIGHIYMKAPLFAEELRRGLSKLADDGLKAILVDAERGRAPQEAIDAVTILFNGLSKMAKDGQMDAAASLNGPDKDGLYHAIAAVQFKDAKKFEKAFIALAMTAPPERERKMFKFDAAKIGDVAVHEVDFTEVMPESVKKTFGKSPKIGFCTTEEGAFFVFGSDVVPGLKSALAAKKGPAPIIEAHASPKKMTDFVVKLGGQIGGIESTLMAMDSFSLAKLEVEGGDKLKIKLTTGAALPFSFGYLMAGRSSSREFDAPKAIEIKVKEKE